MLKQFLKCSLVKKNVSLHITHYTLQRIVTIQQARNTQTSDLEINGAWSLVVVILLAGFASMSTDILLENPFRPKSHSVSFLIWNIRSFQTLRCLLHVNFSCVWRSAVVVVDHAFIFLDSASCLFANARAIFISQTTNLFGSPNLPMDIIL